MEYLHYISGPLIGAFIGYCTNYIAVKMLFHPYKEVKFLGIKLPFTPGVIPKNKPRLARAISRAADQAGFGRAHYRHRSAVRRYRHCGKQRSVR